MIDARPTVRVALWGLGTHAVRNLIPALRHSARTELVAVHTRNRDVLDQVARDAGVHAYADTDDLLAAPDVDAVYVATPSGVHSEPVRRCIDAGKHVWCEKPLTTHHEQTLELLDRAARSEVVLLETDMFLHHPQFRRTIELIESGEIGQLMSMTARFGFPHRDAADFRYTRELGGGALLDAGFYTVAAAVGILGRGLEVVGSTVVSAAGMEVDTGGTALAVAAGKGAVLDWGFGRSYRSEIEVWCEDGVIQLSRAFAKPADLETEIRVLYQSGEMRSHEVPAANQFALMLDHFAAVTQGDDDYDYQTKSIVARSRVLSDIRAGAT